MKAMYIKLKIRIEGGDTLAMVVCFFISLSVFFILKVLSRELPL
ncbi:hypothetical protein [Zobellia galactanivorans]|uniref:Uncharacterized protein n=1 Tax=Zobellia galactanivorans (strain DSM 12802 / CCUG 47099 / CIP 106680 / NCIMB 13871 / Dsij) TaxID=63186 RepID=G0LCB7_ZOBGA|nr:hypothetical protein [Zobellia galactanivorans]CAZ96808.1 Putative protein [Zobellia galactanivorans]